MNARQREIVTALQQAGLLGDGLTEQSSDTNEYGSAVVLKGDNDESLWISVHEADDESDYTSFRVSHQVRARSAVSP
jgi:hypothetical protein